MEGCRVFIIGDSLFTETLAHLLANAAGVQLVGTAGSSEAAASLVNETRPQIIIVADLGRQVQDPFGSLLALFPDTPLISADLNRDYVQVITSRRVSARRDDLLTTIYDLARRPAGE